MEKKDLKEPKGERGLTVTNSVTDSQKFLNFIPIGASYLVISLVNLFTLPVLIYWPSSTRLTIFLAKQIGCLFFGIICILGIIAGISPGKCTIASKVKKRQNSQYKDETVKIHGVEGIINEAHHPKCHCFSWHILRVGGKKVCAGCTGLITGATVAVVGSFLYGLMTKPLGIIKNVFFWSGFLGVFLGLLQYNLSVKNSYIHFLLNISFVLGAFALFIGINELSANFSSVSYYLVVIVFWIWTRIILSENEHKRICRTCPKNKCETSSYQKKSPITANHQSLVEGEVSKNSKRTNSLILSYENHKISINKCKNFEM